MSITSNRKSVIGRVSLGLAAAAAATTLLGACSPSAGHTSTATSPPGGTAVHNIFRSSSHSPASTGPIVLAAKTSAQASEEAVQAFSDSLPDTPLFNAFKQGLFNGTHSIGG